MAQPLTCCLIFEQVPQSLRSQFPHVRNEGKHISSSGLSKEYVSKARQSLRPIVLLNKSVSFLPPTQMYSLSIIRVFPTSFILVALIASNTGIQLCVPRNTFIYC